MKRLTVIAFALCASCGAFAKPVVSDISVSQNEATRLVTVSYALSEDAVVTFDVRTNGVSIGGAQVQGVVGDANVAVSATAGDERRHIYWQPSRGWAGVELADGSIEVVVTAWPKDDPPPYLVVDLVCINQRNWYQGSDFMPGGVTNDLYKTSKLAMRRIPAKGAMFRMGSPLTEGSRDTGRERPHWVTFTNDWYAGVYEITQRQGAYIRGSEPESNVGMGTTIPMANTSLEAFRGSISAGYNWPTNGSNVGPDSRLDRLRTRTGLLFDLPTEAMWEFTCRAGTETAYNNGSDTNIEEYAWFKLNSDDERHPVGLKKPNAWGLYDMIGNASEICLDHFEDNLAKYGNVVTNPPGTSVEIDKYRPVRGGHALGSYAGGQVRSAYRTKQYYDSPNAYLGFRVFCPAVCP